MVKKARDALMVLLPPPWVKVAPPVKAAPLVKGAPRKKEALTPEHGASTLMPRSYTFREAQVLLRR